MIPHAQRPLRALVAAALLSSGLATLAVTAGASSPAHADPSYEIAKQPYVGLGSDTIQDLFNAFSGAEPTEGPQPSEAAPNPTQFYTPLHTSAATGSLQIDSFDATNPHNNYVNPDTGDVITTKLNGPTFDRPNGSGQGRQALFETTQTGGTFSNLGQTAEPVAGQVDFARSSSTGTVTASNTPGDVLSYIPFASDGVGYAYICPAAETNCAAVANLTTTDFKALYTGNGKSAAGVAGGNGTGVTALPVWACAINSGSGTFSYFLSQTGTGLTAAQAGTNLTGATTSNCNGLEVNNLNVFLTTSGGLNPNVDWVIPTSIGNDIAQHNGVSLDRSSNFWCTGVGTPVAGCTGNGPDIPGQGLAAVSDAWTQPASTLPYSGDGTATWAPNNAYDASTFGSWLFVVVASVRLEAGKAFDQGLADLFDSPLATGGTAALCAGTSATISKFGFDAAMPNNGDLSANETGGTPCTVAFIANSF